MRQAGAMRAGSLAFVAMTAGGLLWAFGPALTDLPARPGLTGQWLRDDPERALLTATALAAWVVLAWLALGLVVCALTAVPGTAGSVAERLSRHLVPATVRRAAGLAVGASLATAPVLSAGTAIAAPAALPWQSTAPAVPEWQSTAPAVPPPMVAMRQPANPAGQGHGPEGGWPDLGRHPSTAPPADATATTPPPAPTPLAPAAAPTPPAPTPPAPAAAPTPAPPDTPAAAQARPDAPVAAASPDTAAPAPAAPDPAPVTSPAPVMSPAPTLAGPASPADPSPAESGIYRVRRGDCLWTIAARSLGPGAGPVAIEAAWHRWYQTNRHVVGADPNLLLPGQRLTPPSG